MFERIIRFAIEQRIVVMIAVLIMAGIGIAMIALFATAFVLCTLRKHETKWFLRLALFAIPLPWIAVLIANDRPPRTAQEPRRYDAARRAPMFPTAERPAIEDRHPVIDGDVEP